MQIWQWLLLLTLLLCCLGAIGAGAATSGSKDKKKKKKTTRASKSAAPAPVVEAVEAQPLVEEIVVMEPLVAPTYAIQRHMLCQRLMLTRQRLSM
jgi:hypothetical protein